MLLAPVPIAVLQPILARVADHVARAHPELFARLGPHGRKRFLIDPIDLPFVLVLVPDATRPQFRVCRRDASAAHDAGIAGTFLDLLDMVDGSLDGDALFFTRDLSVTGDTEAVVALRNALDDIEGSVAECATGAFGPLSGPAALALAAVRAFSARSRNA
jgi:predicted lipid carrier protein YhbT